MKYIIPIIGCVIGVLLVRWLWLNEYEVMGWQMFWHGILNGDFIDLEVLFHSHTLRKCLAGGVVGVMAGALIEVSFVNRSEERGSSED
ncbi:hypothetical protein P4E94_14770 [Pontiellaceae bacterium B12219]|nr:hypothetical protein [Pontiellaceae bacterium B12219]